MRSLLESGTVSSPALDRFLDRGARDDLDPLHVAVAGAARCKEERPLV